MHCFPYQQLAMIETSPGFRLKQIGFKERNLKSVGLGFVGSNT
jgi:hypothetical protein